MAKKEVAPLPTKAERFRLNQMALSDKFGEGSAYIPGGGVLHVPRVPTGSLRLDYATGGGLVVGKTITIYGGESSGKTSLVLRFIASAQRYCSNCWRVPVTATLLTLESGATVVSAPDGVGGYVDLLTGKSVPLEKIEQTVGTIPFCDCYKQKLFVPKMLPGEKDDFEPKDDFERRVELYRINSFEPVLATYNDVEGDLDVPWARTLGVDLDRLAISTGDTGEEVADVVAYQIQSCNTDIVVVDSLAMMTPTTELEDSANDSRVGVQPRLLNHCMRVWTQARVNAWR